MFRYRLTFLFLLFVITSPAQRVIRGTVSNTNGQALPNCNVFINNSTRGTVTDANGRFELNEPPSGKHELIISNVGYETYVLAYSEEQLPLTLTVSLKLWVRELDNVVVEPFSEGTWAEWGAKFLENFVGTSANASRCRIRNTDSIHFRYYKRSNRLVAFADVPLLIENEALGYRISYQMEAFELNFKEGSLYYAGYPQVSEMEAPRKGVESRWSKQRQKAYEGSVIHFMRSLYEHRLAEEGFEIRTMKKELNVEKDRVKPIWKKALQEELENGKKAGRVVVLDAAMSGHFPKDTLEYYQRILRQEDMLEIYSPVITNTDSLLEQNATGEKILFFTDYLSVVFKKETEDDAYLRSQGLTRRPVWQRSYIGLLNGNAIAVEANGGYYDPRDLLTMGYWGWSEKMADYMPVDYEPSAPPEKK